MLCRLVNNDIFYLYERAASFMKREFLQGILAEPLQVSSVTYGMACGVIVTHALHVAYTCTHAYPALVLSSVWSMQNYNRCPTYQGTSFACIYMYDTGEYVSVYCCLQL